MNTFQNLGNKLNESENKNFYIISLSLVLMKYEIVLFQSGELAEHIEVRLDEEKETFWMTLKQISNLFERDNSVISKHFKYIFKENELDKNSVVAFFATTANNNLSSIIQTWSKHL